VFVEVLQSAGAPLVAGQIELQLPKQEKAELHNLPQSGRPVTAARPEILQHDDAIVRKDDCFTTQQLVLGLSINKSSVSDIIQNLGYLKVCTRQAPQNLTVEHKTERNPFLPSC
jgi:hypothetical protein